MIKLKKTTCNLCGSNNFEIIYPRKNVEIFTFKENYTVDINNVICKNCGLVFQEPIIDRKKLETFYKYQYRIDISDGSGGSTRMEQKKYIQKFFTRKSASILDIGSFDGYFLN